MKTWHYELMIVTAILCAVTFLYQCTWTGWLTTLAVMLTFQHAQISDRLSEGQKFMTNPDVKCYWKLDKLFVLKELVWIITFFLLHSYAAIVGSILFAVYPVWRRIYRKKRPRNRNKKCRTVQMRGRARDNGLLSTKEYIDV